MKKYLILGLLSIFIEGCAQTPQTINLSEKFDSNSAKKMLMDGKNSISGEAFLRQQGGGIVTCAGEEVRLIPATKYAKERLFYIYTPTTKNSGYNPFLGGIGKNQFIFNPDEIEYSKMQKTTLCDSNGKFKFNNLADGEFFIVVPVYWWSPSQAGVTPQGGSLSKSVSLKNGTNKEIIITK